MANVKESTPEIVETITSHHRDRLLGPDEVFAFRAIL
jgi:hypothetical protein